MAFLRSLLGAALITGACSAPSPVPAEPLTLDFGKGKVIGWRALNDGVMGGRSIGVVNYSRHTMTWEGVVSLENNGGFSSVRSPWGLRDLSRFRSMTFRCRTTTGEADTFTLTMETHEQWWMPYWKANLTVGEEWNQVTLDFSDLKKSSAMTGDLPKLWSWGALDDILRIGLMKYDGTAGDFGLEVDWIRFNPA
jgi:NADH dehydrogenase [ubiquinone] 1 alpha subcomplex assembly factor 1